MVESLRRVEGRSTRAAHRPGEMAEWLKAHAWKACVPQGTVGSNPTLSASTSTTIPTFMLQNNTQERGHQKYVFMLYVKRNTSEVVITLVFCIRERL
jgi:hypothetical protein